MRASFFLIALFPLLAMGCAGIAGPNESFIGRPGVIPAQTDAEPRTILLTEMAKRLGWEVIDAYGTYDHAIKSPTGDRITDTEDSDILMINDMFWRFERDAVAKPGNDLLVPESVFEYDAKRFVRSDLVRKAKLGSK